MILSRLLRKRPPIYNSAARVGLRNAGRFNAQLMDFVRTQIGPGITTNQLDNLVYSYTLDHGHTPACLGYEGYPKTICTSVNDVVCHGIPNDTVLVEGDIVNVDLTTIVQGWFGDQSETFMIGEVPATTKRLVQAAFDSLWKGIRAIKPFGTVYDVGSAIAAYAKPLGYGVVEEYQGHGIGREFHQEPGVPHFAQKEAKRDVLKPGMCFTIEPMLNMGSWETNAKKPDGWTVRTKDGSLSAQFEHTVFVTEDGAEVLTITEHGPQEGHKF